MADVRYVSGIQPSGDLHLGNYFGALVDQRAFAGDNAFFFVADLHALAAGRDPEGVERATIRAAATCLAIGLDEAGGHLFRQSDVGEILQMQWLLGTVVRLEDLEVDEDVRARRERGAVVSASRAGYAILMAADILALRATHVIVGADQEQHLRMVRQYAQALNLRCDQSMVPADVQRVPQRPRPVVLGRGGVKMSKSVGNGLSLRATRDQIAAYVTSLHSDGDLPDHAEDCVLLNLFRHLSGDSQRPPVADYEAFCAAPSRILALREHLIESLDVLLGAWREDHAYYETPEGLAQIDARLEAGAQRARESAERTVREVRGALRTHRPVGRGRPRPTQDGPQPLSYSDYVGVPALIASMAPPAHSPKGVDPAEWPWATFGPSIAAHGGDASLAAQPAEPWQLPPLPRAHPGWAHDEVLFITTHQAFEVWFRHALFELDDMVSRVQSIFAQHGIVGRDGASPIPHSVMMRRHPERVARMHFEHTLRAHEQLATLVRRIEEEAKAEPGLLEYAEWIQESPRPGAFPDDIELPEFRMAWFAGEFPLWADRLDRVAHIIRTATTFYEVLRRMPPKSFLEFRSRLDPASGFGSGQFRELEIFSGQRERHFGSFGTLDGRGDIVDDAMWQLLNEHIGDEQEAREIAARAVSVLETALPADQFMRVRARMLGPTLRDLADLFLLAGTGDLDKRHALSDRIAATNFEELYETGKRRRAHGFAHTHGEREMWRMVGAQLSHMESIAATAVLGDDPSFGAGDLDDAGRREFKRFLESCLELDRAFMAWRIEHLSFVEAMIGARPGTGGGGLVYLQATMQATRADYVLRSFPPVWAARSLLNNR